MGNKQSINGTITSEDETLLTADNYYSDAMNEKYMSFHTYLSYAGHFRAEACEERAEAIRKGLWEEPTTLPLLVGSYVDSFYDGTLDKFKEEHPDIFTQKGELKAPYKQAEKMIARTLEDELFQKAMSGEKQVIMTANWEGVDWKCKIDSYAEGKFITDLKTSADIHRSWRIQDYGYASFAEAYFYDGQMALYQKIVEINTGKKLPCYLAVVTKEDYPEIAVVNIDQARLDNALNEIKMNLPSVMAVRDGTYAPTRCERCNYCKATRKLKAPISMDDLIWGDE